MAKRTTTKKRNPADVTLRNVRASKNRDLDLKTRILRLEKRMAKVMAALRLR